MTNRHEHAAGDWVHAANELIANHRVEEAAALARRERKRAGIALRELEATNLAIGAMRWRLPSAARARFDRILRWGTSDAYEAARRRARWYAACCLVLALTVGAVAVLAAAFAPCQRDSNLEWIVWPLVGAPSLAALFTWFALFGRSDFARILAAVGQWFGSAIVLAVITYSMTQAASC